MVEMATGKNSPTPSDDIIEDDDDVVGDSKIATMCFLEAQFPVERPDAVRPAQGADPSPDTPPRGCTTVSGVPPTTLMTQIP